VSIVIGAFETQRHSQLENVVLRYITRPEGTKEELEDRRKQAMNMLEYGLDPPEVAKIVGVRRGSVYRWKRTYDEEGMEGLDAKPQKGGRNPALPEDKLPELEELLLDGAEAHGFETDLWTLPRIVTVIEDAFDVSVSTTAAYRYLQKLDWTNQKPQHRAAERDEEAIEQFRTERAPELQKKPTEPTEH
jgi:transposase